jgi:hypothetical protein
MRPAETVPLTLTAFVVVAHVKFLRPKDVVVDGNTPKWEKSVKYSYVVPEVLFFT